MNIQDIDNIDQLRGALLKLAHQVWNKQIDPIAAGKINSSLRSVCTTVKLQLDYAHNRREKASIPFMRCGTAKPEKIIPFRGKKAA